MNGKVTEEGHRLPAGDNLCPGFANPRASGTAARVPNIRFRGLTVLAPDPATGEEKVLGELEKTGSWALMSVFEDAGRAIAVFEDIGSQEGRVAFVTENGPLLELHKSLEATSATGTTWYRGHNKRDVLPGMPDILRYELLDGGADPDPEDVRACFPPVRRSFWQGTERPHTFVGTPTSADVVPIYYVDNPMVSRVPFEVVAPGTAAASQKEIVWEGLVGGWLPVVRMVYPLDDSQCWEVLAFATVEGASQLRQPTWYRFVRLNAGNIEQVRYVDSYVPYPDRDFSSAEFYRSLLSLHTYWHGELQASMRIRAPEPWLEDFCRHALALEMITRTGDHPKYGVVERAYSGAEHDGFQDALTSTVVCALEWGLSGKARGYLDYYFEHFVCGDGTLRYRGPEIGKYGVMLSCMAQYYDYSADASLLEKHDHKLRAIVNMLRQRWEEARRLDPSNPAYGMIKGHHEADLTFLRSWENEVRNTPDNPYQLTRGPGSAPVELPPDASENAIYEQPYLSNTGEAWRGVRDIARSWQRAGEMVGDRELTERGSELLETSSAIFGDARRGVERSWLEKDGEVGLPIIAGSSTFYWEKPYRLAPESFDENRVWSELLHSGVAPEETAHKVMEVAGKRGGTTLGIFNNRQNMIGFLVAEAVHGLLQHDMVPEALLAFYAHAFHAHTRGTWTALEGIDMDRDRAAHAPYCAPAQVTVPTITKWLLVFEDPLEGTLVLGKGTPRAWLGDGKGFAVEACPTRWGPISYSISSRLRERELKLEATITMPPRPGAVVQLRLRLPSNHVVREVEVVGEPHLDLVLHDEHIRLPAGIFGQVKLKISCPARR